MTFIVRNAEGKYLDDKRGWARDWVHTLAKAGTFPTLGKAKLAYSHATRKAKRWNQFPNVTPKPIPSFEAVEVAIVTVKELERLKEAAGFLECLKACGVDNWNGYSEARQLWNATEDA